MEVRAFKCEVCNCQNELEVMVEANGRIFYFCQEHFADDTEYLPPMYLLNEQKEKIVSAINLRKKNLRDLEAGLVKKTNYFILKITGEMYKTMKRIRKTISNLDEYLDFILHRSAMFEAELKNLEFEDCEENIGKNLNTTDLEAVISDYYEKDFTKFSIFQLQSVDLSLASYNVASSLKVLAMHKVIIKETPDQVLLCPSKNIIIVSRQNLLQFYKSNESSTFAELKLDCPQINCMAITYNSDYLAAGTDSGLALICLRNFFLKDFKKINSGRIQKICPGNCSQSFATGNYDGKIMSWSVDINLNFMISRLGHPNDLAIAVTSLIMTMDDKFIVSGGNNKDILVWDRSNMELIFMFDACPGGVKCLAVCSDNIHIASVRLNDEVKLWNFKMKTLVWTIAKPNILIRQLGFSLDSKFLIACGQVKFVAWGLESPTKVLEFN